MTVLNLFMDESFDYICKGKYKNDLSFGALIGILMPTNIIDSIENELYEFVKNTPRNGQLTKYQTCTMLHGSKFLPDADDIQREKILDKIINIINKNKIKIIRFGNRITKENMNFFSTMPIDPSINNGKSIQSPQDVIIGLCFLGLNDVLQVFLLDHKINPIMELDKTNYQQERNISGPILSSYKLLNSNDPQSCSFPNNKNMSEPLYLKKGTSLSLSIADCILYLLNIVTTRPLRCDL